MTKNVDLNMGKIIARGGAMEVEKTKDILWGSDCKPKLSDTSNCSSTRTLHRTTLEISSCPNKYGNNTRYCSKSMRWGEEH